MLVLALSYGEQVLLLSPKIVYHWLTALLPSGQGQRADRLIKHPWELEARWRGSNGAHASSAEQAMPRESTLARGGQTRRARATGWLARFINAGPGRSRRAALTHPWQGRHRPRCWLAVTWQC